MKTVKRVIFTAVALVALSGWAYSASPSDSSTDDSGRMDSDTSCRGNDCAPGTGSGAGGSTDMDMDRDKDIRDRDRGSDGSTDGATEKGTGDSSPEMYQGNPGGVMGTYSSSRGGIKKNW